MNSACLTKIQNVYPLLTPAERKVADFVLREAGQVVDMTVSKLADRVGIAASGVIRFCRHVGYRGFTQLKIDLLRSTETPRDILLPAVQPDDSTEMVLEKVIHASIRTLTDTLALIDRSAFERATERLYRASRIEFFGVGTSATIAMDAYFRLMRIGYPAFFATDPLIMRLSASGMGSGQVAVGISHSGFTDETIDAIRRARSHGASTLVITSHLDSPICALADIVLCVFSEENHYPIEAVSARIAHIAILDALCVALALKNQDRSIRHIREMNDLFDGLRGRK